MTKILVPPTRPVLPNFDQYVDEIKSIWQTGAMTNNGPKLRTFKSKLQEYLNHPNLDLFVNGHSALEIALHSLKLDGEVITSPFTFISTTNAIVRSGLTPVFCDVDNTYNIDPNKIEELITEKTSAIVTPHIFGIPCDVKRIEEIAAKHNLKLIFDAAQAFGTKVDGRHVVLFGDITMVSFHAIKIFNSIEGGMLVYKAPSLQKTFELYRNFGVNYETSDVDLCGFNAKMNEFQAAMGLCNLPNFENEIATRHKLALRYAEKLAPIAGVKIFDYKENVRYNHAYYPVLIDEAEFGLNRDTVWERLRDEGIMTRKLYDRLTCDTVAHAENGRRGDLSTARKLSTMSLDLPMYGTLTFDDVDLIANSIAELKR